MGQLYLALLHHPVYDRGGRVVSTAITNLDIHDIARLARTFAVSAFYLVTPVATLRRLAEKIIDHWERGYGSTYNETRREALALVRVARDLEGTICEVEREAGALPYLVATSARPGGERLSFTALRRILAEDPRPCLLLLGTGWGLAREVLERADRVLEPIHGCGDYNHLSVRSAAAIILDRLRFDRY